MVFNALTFAKSLGRCWKPRAPASVFNTSLGTWRTLMPKKPCLIPILVRPRKAKRCLQRYAKMQIQIQNTLKRRFRLNLRILKIEGKAMIRNWYNYPTPPIRDIKGKETQSRNNWTLIETSLAESQTDSYFPTKWPNGYPKQKDVSDTHIQRRTITEEPPWNGQWKVFHSGA